MRTFRAIVEGKDIGRARSPERAVELIVMHLRSNEHLIEPGRKIDTWVVRGDDVVVQIEAEYTPLGALALGPSRDGDLTDDGRTNAQWAADMRALQAKARRSRQFA